MRAHAFLTHKNTTSLDDMAGIAKVNRFKAGQLMNNVLECLMYLVRYKIGRIIPEKGWPQTLIVVARKRNGNIPLRDSVMRTRGIS